MPDMFKVSINKTSKFKAYNCPRLTIAVIKYSGKSNIKNEYFICTRYIHGRRQCGGRNWSGCWVSEEAKCDTLSVVQDPNPGESA